MAKKILYKGLDVSHWQGNYNFQAARDEGYRFVIIKAGGHEANTYYSDKKFEENYNKAKAAGMWVGAYYYSDAYNAAEGAAQANAFLKLLKGKQFDMPVYIDFESARQKNATRADNKAAIQAFCNTMEAANYFAGFYTYTGFINGHLDTNGLIGRYAFWLAHYGTPPDSLLNPAGMWQYSSSNYVAGVRTDTNNLYEDYPTVIKAEGKNGYPKPHTHTIVNDAAVAATCTTAGKTAGKHCATCGEVITTQTTVPATGHKEVKDAAVAATCTKAGKTEGIHCATCGKVLKAQTTVPQLAHTQVKDPVVAATCTAAGKTEGVHCSVCGVKLKPQNSTAPLGHNYLNGKCTRCGEVDPNYNPALDVNKDGKVNTKDMTALMKGISEGKTDSNYDVNEDGKVNAKDLTRMMKELAGN